jgi:hypothetical protein
MIVASGRGHYKRPSCSESKSLISQVASSAETGVDRQPTSPTGTSSQACVRQISVNTKANLVRLLGAVTVSVAACIFVALYSRIAHFRFLSDHPGGSFSKAAEFLTHRAWLGYILPAVALVAGCWSLRRVGQSSVWIEVVIAGTWLLSLVWFGYCVLAWEVQNCPVFSHMELHY